jgi:carboxyl-terminal processing protease
MLAGLDPHSGYMNPHTFRDMQVQTRDELGGLGIEDAHSLAASR